MRNTVLSAYALYGMHPNAFRPMGPRVLFHPLTAEEEAAVETKIKEEASQTAEQEANAAREKAEAEAQRRKATLEDEKRRDEERRNAEKMIPQSEVARIVAEERRKAHEQARKDVEIALKNENLTKEERDALSKRKEELEKALMSEKERSRLEKDHIAKDFELKLSTEKQRADAWRDRFATSSREREITDSAVRYGAKNASQIRDMVSHRVQLMEVKDDKLNPTGEYANMIEVAEKDDKGKVIKRMVSIDEYVGLMARSEEHGNLFSSSRLNGTGSRPGGGVIDGLGGSKDDPAHTKIGRGIRNLANGRR